MQLSDARKIYNQTHRRPDLERHPDHHRRRGLRRPGSARRRPAAVHRLCQARTDRLRTTSSRNRFGRVLRQAVSRLASAGWASSAGEAGRNAGRGSCPVRCNHFSTGLRFPRRAAAIAVGRQWRPGSGPTLIVRSPIDGSVLASLATATADDVPEVLDAAVQAFHAWRLVPAPRRGELVRRLGEQPAPAQIRPGRPGQLGRPARSRRRRWARSRR